MGGDGGVSVLVLGRPTVFVSTKKGIRVLGRRVDGFLSVHPWSQAKLKKMTT